MNLPESSTPLRIAVAVLAALLLPVLPACGGGGGGLVALATGDMDGDGIPDVIDNDLDGDGLLNRFDDDVDGDNLPNRFDPDIDGDGIDNGDDPTPYGPWIPASQTLFVSNGVATVGFGDVPVGQTAGPARIRIQNDTLTAVEVTRVRLEGSGAGAFQLDRSALPGASFPLAAGAHAEFEASFTPRDSTAALGRVVVGLRIDGQDHVGVVHLLGMSQAPLLLTSGASSSMNFGDVPVGLTAGPGVATLRNDTSVAYRVEAIELTGSGGDTFGLDLLGTTFPFDLAPGEEVSFHLSFTPRQGAPSIGEVQVRLEPGANALVLDLFGQGVAPTMLVTPADLDFGTALAGAEVVDIEVQVANAPWANGLLTVSSVELLDAAGGAFALVGDPTPFSLAPGDAPVGLTLRFQPSSSDLGHVTGSLRIVGNDPEIAFDRRVALEARGAGWVAPPAPVATDLATSVPGEQPTPVALAGSSLLALRSAGPDGVFGGALGGDDQLVIIDADPDGDPETQDARVLVRWSGFALSPTPAGAPVDAGNGRHVFFLEGGLDGTFGSADDRLYVLDVLSGTSRALACPNVGERKSRPTIVDPASSRVVVATGLGGGLLASADSLLVYENLLGDVNAAGPSATVALEVVVPDVDCCAPVVVSPTMVVMPAADASDEPDLSDRELDDGNEGLVRVADLGNAASAVRILVGRALATSPAPAGGDAFCRPVPRGATSVIMATEGVDPTSASDDEIVRIDGLDTAAPTVAAARIVADLDGVASRPVALDASHIVFASPGTDGAYGTADDLLLRVDTTGSLLEEAFGPAATLAGGGGAASRPLVLGTHVVVVTAGPNGVVGDADDRALVLDPHVAGAASVVGTLPLPGGALPATRASVASVGGPLVLDDRFVGIVERGADGIAGTADDVLRVFRDLDRDGVFGATGDDLDGNGSYGPEDGITVPMPFADEAATPFVAMAGAHFLSVEPGADGALGGGDDRVALWRLRGSATLP